MDKLINVLDNLNVKYDNSTIEKFSGYMDGVLEWNEKVNLTAITEREEFISKHFIDSIVCANLKEYIKGKSVIDIGTGAGFPGVPLAIVSPEKQFVLADSLNKRLKIIDELTNDLNINNVETVHGRAEELAKNKKYREKFDLCVSRAVANLSTLSEYCLPFIRVGGYMLAYKGPVAEEELIKASNAIKILGGEVVRIEPAEFDGYKHNIIVIRKVKKTGSKYPRKAGTPSKEPIK